MLGSAKVKGYYKQITSMTRTSSCSSNQGVPDPNGTLQYWDTRLNQNHCGWNCVTCSNTTIRRVVHLNLTDLGRLSSLESLSVAGNFLSGPITVELANLKQLMVLNLHGNNFQGPFPLSFTKFPSAQTLRNLICVTAI